MELWEHQCQISSLTYDHAQTANTLPKTMPGRLIQYLMIGQLKSHETNRRRVSDNNNISQLLRDSFSVSQQPPIWEPPSHYSMVFILYIYLFSTFIDLALIRYNKNMLQKTDNPLNIVWCWNNIFVYLYNIFSVYSKYRDRSRKTLPMKHLDSRWKRVTTTGAVCPVAVTTAAIFTSASRCGWHQPLSRVSGGHTAAGQLHIYRQPEGSGIIKSILNTAPSWYLNIARKPA